MVLEEYDAAPGGDMASAGAMTATTDVSDLQLQFRWNKNDGFVLGQLDEDLGLAVRSLASLTTTGLVRLRPVQMEQIDDGWAFQQAKKCKFRRLNPVDLRQCDMESR
jgi:hypothetical protein